MATIADAVRLTQVVNEIQHIIQTFYYYVFVYL